MTEHQQTPAIEIDQLRFFYQGADNKGASSCEGKAYVVDIKHWQVPAGQHVFLRGASGSGKSTLLNLLAGILTPVEGHINILGHTFSELAWCISNLTSFPLLAYSKTCNLPRTLAILHIRKLKYS